jgi:hypothetical protein
VDNVIAGDHREDGDLELDCVQAMHIARTRYLNMVEGFAAQLNIPLLSHQIVYLPTTEEEDTGFRLWREKLGHRPFVLIARHSKSCSSHKGGKPNKCFDNKYWLQIGQALKDMGIEPVAIGSLDELEEERFKEWPWSKLYGIPLEHIATLMEYSQGLISVDTGVRFLASAMGANFLVISCALPTWLVSTKPSEYQLGMEINMSVDKLDMPLILSLLNPLFNGSTQHVCNQAREYKKGRRETKRGT